MQQEIWKAIEQALEELGVADAAFVVERPGDLSHGDYATNAAMVGFASYQDIQKNFHNLEKRKQVQPIVNRDGFEWKIPKELAENLKLKLQDKIGGVSKIEIAGPGFINFFLSQEAIVKEVEKISANEALSILSDFTGKTVLVEYTSPNLFKPLHIGNLIGNILGESITRILEASGANVKRINYPSDIGLTVAKGVWGIRKNNFDPNDIAQLGQAYVLGNAAYEEDEDAKKEIEIINKALYEGDPELTLVREAGIKTSLRHLEELCQTLGTAFDATFFESQTAPLGRDIVAQYVTDGIFEKSEGAVVYKGEEEGLHTRVFLNSQGLPTYEAKDIGLFSLKQRAYPQFDASITVTGSEQKDYFKVVFAAIRKVFTEETDGKLLMHVANGFLRLTIGKMSSRKGNVITGESLLMGLKDAAKEKMEGRTLKDHEKTAQQVAVGAIKYAVLKQGRGKDIIFDPEKSLSLEGDSGPYVQYAYTRALSLLRKAEAEGLLAKGEAWPSGLERPESATLPLERTLIHFSEVVAHAAAELEPHYITTYLTELASLFNSWYANERIIGGKHPEYGVLLVQAFANTMQKGLMLLGIPAPEEM